MRIAVCPGSYDPVTNGHLDVIQRACDLFDEVHVVIGTNASKPSLLDLETRLALLRSACAELPVRVEPISGLLADYVRAVGAAAIVKGLRGGADLDYEQPQALMNRQLSGVDTVFLVAAPGLQHLSSSLVKDVARHGGDVATFVPPGVLDALRRALSSHAPTTERKARP